MGFVYFMGFGFFRFKEGRRELFVILYGLFKGWLNFLVLVKLRWDSIKYLDK